MPLEQLQAWIVQYGYAAIYVLLAVGIVGLPVPDETLLTLTGFLVFKGTLSALPAGLSALAGTVTGISISYAIGTIGGKRFLRRFGQKLRVNPDRIKKVETWFRKRGRWSLVVGYFIPGVRHLIAIVAGSSGLPYAPFARYAYGGGFLWSCGFIAGGYFLGEQWTRFPDAVRPVVIIAVGVLVLGAGGYFLYTRLGERRGRRK
jgi:membrane protein DedA with SNARE-associated domain